jgi:putative GTP pyrophosphokinase
VSLNSKNIENILDEYDEHYDMYRSYKDRLLVILREIFSKMTIPVSSISGKLMSRGTLRNKLLAQGVIYNFLDDIDNLISLQVVTHFHDDINFSISVIGKEFLINELKLSKSEEAAQDHFGILMKRLSLKLPEEKYNQVEYSRFSSMKAELKIRSAFQNSWFEVKDIFDTIAKKNNVSGDEIDKLAQVSYLLKMADAEICRIRASLSGQNKKEEQANNQQPEKAEPKSVEPERNPSYEKQNYDVQIVSNSEMSEQQIQEHEQFLGEIETFILNDLVVRDLDRNIADYYNTRLVYRQEFASSLAHMYIDIRLDSADKIKNQLNLNKKVIINLIKHIFGDALETNLDEVDRGASLLILFYIMIAQTGNVDIIKRHIKNHTALENMSVDEFANDLIFYYNKSV